VVEPTHPDRDELVAAPAHGLRPLHDLQAAPSREGLGIRIDEDAVSTLGLPRAHRSDPVGGRRDHGRVSALDAAHTALTRPGRHRSTPIPLRPYRRPGIEHRLATAADAQDTIADNGPTPSTGIPPQPRGDRNSPPW